MPMPPTAPRPSASHVLPQVALLAPLALLGLAACHKQAPPAAAPAGPPPALPVSVRKVELVSVPAAVTVVATAEGAREMQVRARVGGILEKRLYQEGQPVKAGQPLFQIELAPLEIRVQSARAQVAEAEAAVATAAAQTAQAGAQVGAARAQAARAESDLAQAKREQERLRSLLAGQAVSQREADAADSTAQSAAAALEAARAQVAAAEAGVKGAEAAAATAAARKESAAAALADAELQRSYATVTAPVDGIVGRAEKSEGALVSPTDGPLTTLAQIDPIWVRFSLSEADLARLPGGADPEKAIRAAHLLLPDGKVYARAGKLNFSASRVDTRLGTRELRAEFPNPDRSVLPGQFLRVTVDAGSWENVCLLPQDAVLTIPQVGQAVFVMAPGEGGGMTAQMRPVKAGAWAGDQWIIEPGEGTGLKAGDLVITNQLSKIGFMMKMGGGQPVAVVDAATLAPAKPAPQPEAKPETKPQAEAPAKEAPAKEGAAR